MQIDKNKSKYFIDNLPIEQIMTHDFKPIFELDPHIEQFEYWDGTFLHIYREEFECALEWANFVNECIKNRVEKLKQQNDKKQIAIK
jgi:hypothetical protein